MFGIGGDRQIISLDWDASSLRAVLWRVRKKRAHVRKLLSAKIPSDVSVKDASSLGLFIRRAFDQENMRAQSVIVDIPRDQAVLHTMSLPPVNLNDLAGMVQLQIAKELPFPLTDAVVDFAVMEQSRSANSVDVMVAAVRDEVLDFYRSVCRQAGLKLERVGLRPYANMVAINELLGPQIRGRVLYVDLGPSLTEIGILRDGSLVFSRAASTRADDSEAELDSSGDAKEKIVQAILVEVTRSAEAYRSTDPGAHFDRIVVAGSTGLEPDLLESLSKRFPAEVRLYDASSVLDASKHQGQTLTGFAAAIGLGLGHAVEGRLHFDFMHPKRPMDAAARRRQKIPLVGGIAATIALCAASVYGFGIHPKKVAIAEQQLEIKKLTTEKEGYDEIVAIVEAAQLWREEQLIWPDELIAFAGALPDSKDAYLTDLKLNRRDGKMDFKIVARDRQIIIELEKRLGALTRQEEGEAKAKFLFLARAGVIGTNKKDAKYSVKTSMTVQSRRILAVKEKSKKKKSRRRRGAR